MVCVKTFRAIPQITPPPAIATYICLEKWGNDAKPGPGRLSSEAVAASFLTDILHEVFRVSDTKSPLFIGNDAGYAITSSLLSKPLLEAVAKFWPSAILDSSPLDKQRADQDLIRKFVLKELGSPDSRLYKKMKETTDLSDLP